MAKKPLEIDMIAGSQLRDTQGEMLSVEGADISELEAGRGRLNDNHGKGFFNSLGRVTGAKKILSKDDCENERQEYFWEKVKAPFIYCKGFLYDDEEHPNAKAAAAILRNIHNSDSPLQLKASVEGGVVSRGIKDDRLLARTKIHSVALTFTPANNATLVEPCALSKSDSHEEDMRLIKSVMHLAKTDVPSFRHITRQASASKVSDNFDKINEIAEQLGLNSRVANPGQDDIVKSSVEQKIINNINRMNNTVKTQKTKNKIAHINELVKALVDPDNSEHELNAYKKSYAQLAVKNGNDKEWLDNAITHHSNSVDHPKYGKVHGQLLSHLEAVKKDPSQHYDLEPKPEEGEFGPIDSESKPDTRMITQEDRQTVAGTKVLPLAKMLSAGYGGAGAPTSRSGGGVIQSEGLDDGRSKIKKEEKSTKGFKYLLCSKCGHEQIYMKHQVKCRDCNKHFPMADLAMVMVGKKK